MSALNTRSAQWHRKVITIWGMLKTNGAGTMSTQVCNQDCQQDCKKNAMRMFVHLRQKGMSNSRSDWSAKSSKHDSQHADQTDLPLISMRSRKADQTDLPTITTLQHTFLLNNTKWTWVTNNGWLNTRSAQLHRKVCAIWGTMKSNGAGTMSTQVIQKACQQDCKQNSPAHARAPASKKHVVQQIRLIC